jgi:hypothetical protein
VRDPTFAQFATAATPSILKLLLLSYIPWLPARHHAALGDEGCEVGHLLGDLRHKLVSESLIGKTFVHIVQKAAAEQWVMEERRA